MKNLGDVVDRGTLEVGGELAPWAVIEPADVSFFPRETAQARLSFELPRAPRPAAGSQLFGVRVRSAAGTGEPATATGQIDVLPFVAVSSDVHPRTSRARRTGRHALQITNDGNAPVEIRIAARDPDDLLDVAVTTPVLAIQAGGSASVAITVKARRDVTPGQPIPFRITVTAQGQPPIDQDASFIRSAAPRAPVGRLAVIAAIALVVAVGGGVLGGWIPRFWAPQSGPTATETKSVAGPTPTTRPTVTKAPPTATPTVTPITPAPITPAPQAGPYLAPGEVLLIGEHRVSPNGVFELVMQGDANLVFYRLGPREPMWASNTVDQPFDRVVMQEGGNLVLTNDSGSELLVAETNEPGAWVYVQDDGNLVLYRPPTGEAFSETALWSCWDNGCVNAYQPYAP